MIYNSLSVNAYQRGSTSPIINLGFDYNIISGLTFESYWPGGLFGTASFYIPQDLAVSWAQSGAYRVVIYNGIQPVYEGYVDSIDRVSDNDTSGIAVTTVGAWGNILAAQGIDKPWWDDRTDAKTWEFVDTGNEEEFEQKLIEGKIHIAPYKTTGFASGEYAAMQYVAPVGQTVKRLKYTYDFAEDSGSWEISMWRSTDGVSFTQMTAGSGETYNTGSTTVITAAASGTIDVTLATPSRWLQFRFYSRGANNPTGVAHIHGMMYDVSVRTETNASITANVIINDVIGECTDLNTSTDYKTAITTTIQPFITDGFETYAKIIERVLNYGDAGTNYYAQLLESDYLIQGADGKPILAVAEYPAVTSAYEYEIALTDENLVAPFTLSEDYSRIANWIPVEYKDKVGKRSIVTPDDDSDLTDATSVALYGRRLPPGGAISVGQINSIDYASEVAIGTRRANTANAVQSGAILYGRRYLAKYKDPVWRLSSPVTVQGYIRQKGEIRKPCSEIRAGERVLFSNFPASPISDPLLGASPLIAIISRTQYTDDNGGMCSLSFGDLMNLW